MNTMRLNMYVPSRSYADAVVDAITSYGGEEVTVSKFDSKPTGEWQATIDVSGSFIDEVVDDPDAFITALWEEVGEYFWVALSAYSEELGKVDDRYAYSSYKDMINE